MILVALILSLVLIGPAFGATWCVPSGDIGGNCPNVSATLQGAIDAAPAGSTIRIGTGTAPERVVVTKRVKLQCLPGAVLTDAGLDPAPVFIDYQGVYNALPLESCDIQVAASDVAISIPASVSWFELSKVTLTRLGERAGIGLLVQAANRVHVGASTISNFAIGGDFRRASWVRLESLQPTKNVWQDNGVGIRCANCQGQIFYNILRRNTVGLHIAEFTEKPVGQLDINSNIFGTKNVPEDTNLVAVQWDKCAAWNTEFNHSNMFEPVVAFRVGTLDGSYLEGDDAYKASVAFAASFADTLIVRSNAGTSYRTSAFISDTYPDETCFE